MTSLTQYVADAMRHVNEVEKKSLTYDDFWRDLAIAAIDAVASYKQSEGLGGPPMRLGHDVQIVSWLDDSSKQSETKSIPYHTTDGKPCTITLEKGWTGEIVDGILQVQPPKTSGDNGS